MGTLQNLKVLKVLKGDQDNIHRDLTSPLPRTQESLTP